MTESENGFGARIAGLRKEKGLSQRAVAGELGVSQALLSHYEKGLREPGLAFVCRLCDYYGVSADYLLGRCGSRTAPEAEELRLVVRELQAMVSRAEQVLTEQ